MSFFVELSNPKIFIQGNLLYFKNPNSTSRINHFETMKNLEWRNNDKNKTGKNEI